MQRLAKLKIVSFFSVFILLVLFMSACSSVNTNNSNYMRVKNANQMTGKSLPENSAGNDKFTGIILAGNSKSPYIVFNEADYDLALASNKTILLYFYANWCPICMHEENDTFAAFDELVNNSNFTSTSSKIIGFRVNYKDSDTDDFEVSLARKYGISYQHTKIILKNQIQVLKSPESWDKKRYLDEINKVE